MRKFLVLALIVLLFCVFPNLSGADQADTEEIIKLKEAFRIDPNNALEHLTIGLAHDNLERYPEGYHIIMAQIDFSPLNNLSRQMMEYSRQQQEMENAARQYELDRQRLELYKKQQEMELERQRLESGQQQQWKENTEKKSQPFSPYQDNISKIKKLEEIVLLYPNNPRAHEQLGLAYYLSNRFDQSIWEYREVIRLEPNNGWAHFTLGTAYNEVGNGTGAIYHTKAAENIFEKENKTKALADARTNLQLLHTKYGYKLEDFANILIPGESKSQPTNQPQPANPVSEPATQVHIVSLGTGVLFQQSANVFTNYHVVNGAKTIKVKFVNGDTILASVSYKDEGNDIAMLTLAKSPNIQLKQLPLGDASKVNIGEKVFTIGYPASNILGKEPKYSEGVVNSLTGAGDDTKMFQISVPIQAGNSGGPLFNERGEVIGMITSTYTTNEALILSGTMPQNVNFAVKSSLFAAKTMSSKGIAATSIVPVPTPFSVSTFVAVMKNNIVLIEAE